MSRILITGLTPCLIEDKPLQTHQRPDHVFTDSFCLAYDLSPDLAVDVETSVAPVEDIPQQGKPDKFFPQQQGEDLVGKNLLDGLVREAGAMMKNTILVCASFGHQKVNVGIEVGMTRRARVLQENISSHSCPQSGHRIRAKPHIGLPQSRYFSTKSWMTG